MKPFRYSNLSRREFLRHSAVTTAAAALPALRPERLFGRTAPSNLITVGFIGVGNIAQGHMDTLLGFPEVRIRAVSDVDRRHREAATRKINLAYENRDCVGYADFREMTARTDLDAVWVCTPDHWHALAAIEAMRSGKDVYVEKPLTLTIHEGRELVNTARKYARVGQTGSNRRSSKWVHDAVEFIRNDGLGKLTHVDVTIPPNNKFCGATWRPEPVPEGLDWDFWLGPAPWSPFTRQGCHYNFRFILDYAAGQVTNFGAHCLDIAQWGLGMDDSGPVEIEGHGEFPTSGLFTTATRVDFTCRYVNGVTVRCRTSFDDNNVRFFGERGWVNVGPRVLTASNGALLKEITAGRGSIKIPLSVNHHDDFLQCMRTRGRPIAEVEIGHRTATVCNLGNIAMQLGRKLHWDPVREEFTGDEVASRMRHRSMRSPWSLI